jgi:hypothetical protein
MRVHLELIPCVETMRRERFSEIGITISRTSRPASVVRDLMQMLWRMRGMYRRQVTVKEPGRALYLEKEFGRLPGLGEWIWVELVGFPRAFRVASISHAPDQGGAVAICAVEEGLPCRGSLRVVRTGN